MNGCRQLRAAHRVDWQGSALTGHAENLQEFVMSPSAAGAAGSYEIEEEQVSELSSYPLSCIMCRPCNFKLQGQHNCVLSSDSC